MFDLKLRLLKKYPFLKKYIKSIRIREVKNTGFEYKIEEPEDYILGVTSPIPEPPIVFPDGHGWHSPLVRAKAEMQFNPKFDSFSCVIFAIAKCLVAYIAQVYKVKITVAEMFNAVMAGVRYGRGTTVRDGMESFRTKGWVEDKIYPFTGDTTQQEYFIYPPKRIILEAQKALSIWDVHWEQLDYSGDVPHFKIINALKRTPTVCSGSSWAHKEGIYISFGRPNHCFPIDEFSDNKDYDLIAYDSYPQDNEFDADSQDEEFEKKLSKNFRIWSAHRIWVTPAEVNQELINKLKNMFNKISRDVHGGLWFLKDGKKQKIENWLAFAGAIIDEIGVNNNNLTDEQLKSFVDNKFFGD